MNNIKKRIHVIVMDSVGIGETPDADKFDHMVQIHFCIFPQLKMV